MLPAKLLKFTSGFGVMENQVQKKMNVYRTMVQIIDIHVV